jgi:hypothetical protein
MSSQEPDNATASANDETAQDRIVQSIYEHITTSVCIGYASNMHELIKTGEIPTSQLKTPSSRQDIFPELYIDKDPAEIQEVLDHYATESPNRHSRKRKLRHTNTNKSTSSRAGSKDDEHAESENDNDDEDFKEQAEPKPTMQSRQTINRLDIWGRMPPKEPTHPCECKLCGRHVSTLRFASHLDKCMGLSTRTPSTATGNPARSNGSMSNTSGGIK